MVYHASCRSISLYLFCIGVILSIASLTMEVQSVRNVRKAASYHGQWDISAKQTATLCEAVKHTDKGGSVTDDIPEPDKSTYTRDGQCWKNQWIPCEGEQKDDRLGSDGVLAKRRKPCGHYKMVSAPESEC